MTLRDSHEIMKIVTVGFALKGRIDHTSVYVFRAICRERSGVKS